MQGGNAELEASLGFLKGGCSKDPLDLLRGAGVDMETPEPINRAFVRFGKLVDELDHLLEQQKTDLTAEPQTTPRGQKTTKDKGQRTTKDKGKKTTKDKGKKTTKDEGKTIKVKSRQRTTDNRKKTTFFSFVSRNRARIASAACQLPSFGLGCPPTKYSRPGIGAAGLVGAATTPLNV